MNERLRPVAGIVVEELGDELCLMRLDTNEVLVLNRTATQAWLLLSAGATEEEIIEEFGAVYGLTDADAAAPVRELLDDLLAHGFLVAAKQ